MHDRYQVFISSTYKDLQRQRRLIAEAIQQKGMYAAGMELFPACDQGAWDHIERSMQESDLYLLIAAGRYGSQKPDTEKSYTELEYELALSLAKSNRLRLAVLIWDNNHEAHYIKNFESQGSSEYDKQRSFRSRLESDMEGGVSYFFDDASLINRTHAALDEFIRHAGPGWVRADQSPSHEEIVALKMKLKKCQHQLNEAQESIQSLLKIAALPDEEFELGCDIEYQLGLGKHTNFNETATVTWDEIFTAVGSSLNSTKAKPRNILEKSITNLATKKFKKISNSWILTEVKVHPEFMERIFNHLIRNQWVKSTKREREGLHFELTTLGREAFLEHQTVSSNIDKD